MRRAPLIASLFILCAAVGCAGRSGHGHGGGAGEPGLEPTQRGLIAPDVTQVGALAQVDQVLGYPRSGGQYHALAPADCQCMAVNAAPRANLLDDERRALAARESRGLCKGEDNSLTYDVLRTAALEDRNRQAGEALNDYYLLAQREAQLDLAAGAIGDAHRGVEGFNKAHQQGLMSARRQDGISAPRDRTARPTGAIGKRRAAAQLAALELHWHYSRQPRRSHLADDRHDSHRGTDRRRAGGADRHCRPVPNWACTSRPLRDERATQFGADRALASQPAAGARSAAGQVRWALWDSGSAEESLPRRSANLPSGSSSSIAWPGSANRKSPPRSARTWRLSSCDCDKSRWPRKRRAVAPAAAKNCKARSQTGGAIVRRSHRRPVGPDPGRKRSCRTDRRLENRPGPIETIARAAGRGMLPVIRPNQSIDAGEKTRRLRSSSSDRAVSLGVAASPKNYWRSKRTLSSCSLNVELCSSTARNSSLPSVQSSMSSLAVTVALRGSPLIRAASPKMSP